MLQRAVAAVKENKDEALAKFNKGEAVFKDRDCMFSAPMPRTSFLWCIPT